MIIIKGFGLTDCFPSFFYLNRAFKWYVLGDLKMHLVTKATSIVLGFPKANPCLLFFVMQQACVFEIFNKENIGRQGPLEKPWEPMTLSKLLKYIDISKRLPCVMTFKHCDRFTTWCHKCSVSYLLCLAITAMLHLLPTKLAWHLMFLAVKLQKKIQEVIRRI